MVNFRLLGLEEKEYQVYKLLLEKGEMTQVDIARTLRFSKPTAKRISEDLEKKGWIFTSKINDRVWYRPEDPNKIKENKIKEEDKIYNEFDLLYKENFGLAKVRLISSKEDFEIMHKDFLQNAKVVYELFNSDILLPQGDKEKPSKSKFFDKKFITINVTNKNTKINKISNDHTIINRTDPDNEVHNNFEIWNDSIFLSKSVNSKIGIYIKNKEISGLLRYLIKQLIK